jgi:hypothetical protein
MIIRFFQLVLVAVAFAMSSAPAGAQMSTQPFNFGGGLGMSEAGRAAILNQQINGAMPEVLLKDESGRPLGVTQGPGGIAVVTGPSGELLPGHRGLSWKGSGSGLSAGVFNEFFVPGRKSDPPFAVASTSGETVDAWTDAVHGPPRGYGNSVDQWTAMTYYLGER